MIKKYFTISEVAKKLEAKEYTLRSLDYLLGKNLIIIRGRRYYQEKDVRTLNNFLQTINKRTTSLNYINDIEKLIIAMIDLRAELISALNLS